MSPGTTDAAFETALAVVLRLEGVRLPKDTGYVNDPDDPGGATNFGIIQASYSAWLASQGLPARPVRAMTLAEASAIYHRNYWRDGGAAIVAELGRAKLALVTFDWSVNAGIIRGRHYLQAALGGLVVDGILGPKTRAAIADADESAAVARYLVLRAAHYRIRAGLDEAGVLRAQLLDAGLGASLIPRAHPPSRKFLRGWLARLRTCARAAGVPIDAAYAARA